MKKEKRNPRSHELIREMIELYHPQSIKDIQEMLKDSEYQCRYPHKTVFHSDSALSVF